MINKETVLLNMDYSFLNIINWRKAIRLYILGKITIIKSYEKKITNSDKSFSLLIPAVVRLEKQISEIYSNKIPFSRKNIYTRDGNSCQYCGSTLLLNIDHVFPECRGGKLSFENSVVSCLSCNRKKGDRTPEEAGMKLRKRPHTPTINEFIRIRLYNEPNVIKTLKSLGVM